MNVYSIAVVGESFANEDGSSRQREIRKCKPAEPVHLERDPANPHDANAIRVISSRGVCIGMIGRQPATWLAERLDTGRHLAACIQSVGTGASGKLGTVLRVSTNEAMDPAAGVRRGWLARFLGR